MSDKDKSKLGSKVASGIVIIAAAPTLINAFGWAAAIGCGLGIVAIIILIVKQLKRK